MARVRLQIVWDGDVPGLKEHRLSLAAFGKALDLMMQALRRLASGIISDALDDPEYGGRGGVYSAVGKQLDVQLLSIADGSVDLGVEAVIPDQPGQQDLLETLPERTVEAFLLAVQSEAKNVRRSAVVRKFLAAVPAGVTRQRYARYDGQREVQVIELGAVTIAPIDEPTELPFLVEIHGDVVGVGFEPGSLEVRVRSASEKHKETTCAATERQVRDAFELRGRRVVAMAVGGQKRPRLLWLRSEGGVPVPPESVTTAILTRWDELLGRLAK